jgi:ribonuclease P protein component
LGSHRFPKGARLVHRREFQDVFARGAKAVGPEFVGYALGGEAGDPKLGIAVSRKVGKAVVRNRVKRLVREWFRTHRGQLRPGLQLVIVARPSAASLRGAQAFEALTALARRWGASA